MTKKDLVKIIQEVVRIEVKKQVKHIFITEEKSTSLKSLTQPVRKKKVVKNQTLNDILNETVGLNSKSQEMDEYPTMGGGAFDSTRASELLGYGGDKQTQREVGAVQTMKEAGVSANQVPDHVQDALTKDYSKLMKHNKMKSSR